MSKECTGCFAYSGSYCKVGIIPQLSDIEHCPCMDCIVKAMCANCVCEVYMKYRDLSRARKSFREVIEDFRAGDFFHYQ